MSSNGDNRYNCESVSTENSNQEKEVQVMDVSMMQPYLFPYIGYFQMINCSDYFVISDNVQYIKRGWINRNRILLDGHAHMITLPVVQHGAFLKINERYFVNDANNQGKVQMLKTIDHAYRKAPNFKDSYELIERVLDFSNNNVAAFLNNSLKEICQYIGIKTPILIKSKLNPPAGLDHQDSIIHVCNKLNADRYINAIGGTELYSAQRFRENGLSLKFIKTRESLNYKQFKNNFVQNLSIIDIMMFNSPAEIRELLTEYDLIDGSN